MNTNLTTEINSENLKADVLDLYSQIKNAIDFEPLNGVNWSDLEKPQSKFYIKLKEFISEFLTKNNSFHNSYIVKCILILDLIHQIEELENPKNISTDNLKIIGERFAKKPFFSI